ncbi:DUF6328 family protein [Naasia lichenicola]|uniref:Sodium:proton antiporter n=1 Tax=Naasia lichenicola TaxID=2565933 RepID=A0A4S4FP76_9MICO|nr:DUF6328 family protein [Naasia lichenicola]THG32353.1 sodium:proton antiporter [Naasia lichenicola]
MADDAPRPSSAPHPADVDADPGDGRDETKAERMDRNWNEILQELRVTQTGTQILTGFLLTLPFQQRFEDLDRFELDVYLVLVGLAVLSTALGLAPVSLHRALFRKKAKEEIVTIADRLLRGALVCIGLLTTGVALLIFDVVANRTAGFIAAGATLVLLALVWLALPITNRPNRGSDPR